MVFQAWRADRRPHAIGPLTHALALGVYCSSWTFFGAVGSAAEDGWRYLPILLGPALVFLFARPFLARLIAQGQAAGTSSVADFLSARYGKSRAVAAAVTLVCVIALLPYLTLQLRAITDAFNFMVGHGQGGDAVPGLVAALGVAGFAILFGVRASDATRRNRGLMTATAIESAVKLAALALVAITALTVITADPARSAAVFAETFSVTDFDDRFLTLTLLSMAAVVCLPREFHVLVVEAPPKTAVRDVSKIFAAYLVVMAMLAPPILLAGAPRLPGVDPDAYVLALPRALDQELISVLAFLGGVSAATAMAVVSAVALGTMVANDLVAPIALTFPRWRDLARRQVFVRRAAIIAMFAVAFALHLSADLEGPLADLGVLSFAAVAQLAPAVIAAVYRPRARRSGVMAGLTVGAALWIALLAGPTLGLWPFLKDWAPESARLGVDDLTLGAGVSLGANILTLFVASVVRGGKREPGSEIHRRNLAQPVVFDRLCALLDRCLDPEESAQVRAALARHHERNAHAPGGADHAAVTLVEDRIARVLGAGSARTLVDGAIGRSRLEFENVVALVDESAQKLTFGQGLLSAALENIPQGVSVVDAELKLVAWNRRYVEMFDYPDGLIAIGRPIEAVLRHNGERGEWGDADIGAVIERRLTHLRGRKPYSAIRTRPDGQVLRLEGRPIPGGGYVTTFDDITEDRRMAAELLEAKMGLERRVEERTRALREAHEELREEHDRIVALTGELEAAKAVAEKADAAKTRFLAAASHDLLQPLNAARLFATALGEDVREGPERSRRLVADIERSIASADRLLRALLDISKLDAGGLKPVVRDFAVQDLFDEIETEFLARARKKGLALRLVPTKARVTSDRGLLLSMLQNLVSNAVRYTDHGGVLIGCRRRGARLRLEVWDTGRGIAQRDHKSVFDEFKRLSGRADGDEERGLGLGLALVERIGGLLTHDVALQSVEGRGSVFSITAPAASAKMIKPPLSRWTGSRRDPRFVGATILCIDDDPSARRALCELLERWGFVAEAASGLGEATAIEWPAGGPDIVIADHHLNQAEPGRPAAATGASIFEELAAHWGGRPACVVVSADRTGAAEDAARSLGAPFLPKPVDPARLRALLAQLLRAAAE